MPDSLPDSLYRLIRFVQNSHLMLSFYRFRGAADDWLRVQEPASLIGQDSAVGNCSRPFGLARTPSAQWGNRTNRANPNRLGQPHRSLQIDSFLSGSPDVDFSRSLSPSNSHSLSTLHSSSQAGAASFFSCSLAVRSFSSSLFVLLSVLHYRPSTSSLRDPTFPLLI